MLLKILRAHQPLIMVVIPLLALVLGWADFVRPIAILPALPGTGPLGQVILNLFSQNLTIATIFACLVVVFQAFFVNHIFNTNELTVRNTFIPAICYLIVASILPHQYQLTAPLLSTTFILSALQRIFQAFNNGSYQGGCLETGLYISIAGLLYTPHSLFLVFVIAGILILRPFSFREVLLILFGFFLPYIYLVLYRFWCGHQLVGQDFREYLHLPTHHFIWPEGLAITPLIAIGFVLLVALYFSFTRSIELGARSIQHRGRIAVMRLMTCVALLNLLVTKQPSFACFLILFIPLVFWTSAYFIWAKKTWFAEILLWLSLLILLFR